jgi:glycosyltransferase involved in cell wall biosynthesis
VPHALHIFSTFAPAGPELRAVELIQGLGTEYRHTIVAMDDCLDAAERLDPGIKTRTLPGPGSKQTTRVLRWTWKLLERESPDLLLTYNWGAFDAVLAARLKRFPQHVHHEDGFNLDEAEEEIPRRRFLRRLALPRVQHLIVPSTNLEQLARHSWRVPPQRLSLVPNGVDTQRYCPQDKTVRDALRRKLGIPANARVVGSVAGYRPVKCLDRLIRSCANLPPDPDGRATHLILIGDGPERQALETLAASHPSPGGKVHLLGFQNDLPQFYAAMDVFALTSASEQQPISLLEAMASGLPAVCTDVGDIRATLGEAGQGTLIEPTASDLEAQLTSALQRVLDDPADRGAQGRERVQATYSNQTMLAAYRRIYEGAMQA